MSKIVVTISDTVQIGIDTWKQKNVSKIFSQTDSIEKMLEWAKKNGFKNPDISDLNFSLLEDETNEREK